MLEGKGKPLDRCSLEFIFTVHIMSKNNIQILMTNQESRSQRKKNRKKILC